MYILLILPTYYYYHYCYYTIANIYSSMYSNIYGIYTVLQYIQHKDCLTHDLLNLCVSSVRYAKGMNISG